MALHAKKSRMLITWIFWSFALSMFIGLVESISWLHDERDLLLRSPSFRRQYIVQQRRDWSESKQSAANDTLAVMILFAFTLVPNATHPRMDGLHCSLLKLTQNVASFTPLHIYLWMKPEAVPLLPSYFVENIPNLFVMPIEPDSWKVPEGLPDRTAWVNATGGIDYYLMGRWRLTYAPDFARVHGYRYMLFIDDDAYVTGKFDFNIVDVFDNRVMLLGHRDVLYQDLPLVVHGLPELTAYWMQTTGYLQPQGPLFEHLEQPNIAGLTSEKWDRVIFSGHFVVIKLEFFYHPVVQDYVNLVLSTGADMTQRWQEQGVLNMLRLLFIPEGQVVLFQQNGILHDKLQDYRLYASLSCPTTHPVDYRLQPELHPIYGKTVVAMQFALTYDASGVRLLHVEKQKELFLFRFVYNATLSSCGRDTAILNDYAAIGEEINERNMTWYENWHVLGVQEKWDKIRTDGNISMGEVNSGNDSSSDGGPEGVGAVVDVQEDGNVVTEQSKIPTTTDSASTTTTTTPATGTPSERCQEVVRQQLRDYLNFYCSYTGIYQGRPMESRCKGLRVGAMQAFERNLREFA